MAVLYGTRGQTHAVGQAQSSPERPRATMNSYREPLWETRLAVGIVRDLWGRRRPEAYPQTGWLMLETGWKAGPTVMLATGWSLTFHTGEARRESLRNLRSVKDGLTEVLG